MERFGAVLTTAKNQSVFSGILHQETTPISSIAEPTKEELSYQLKSRQVIHKLRQEELEITEKLQNLKVRKRNISFLKF